jgi:alpha-glucoside transport system permease protein
MVQLLSHSGGGTAADASSSNVIMLALCLFWLIPLVGLLISSLRPREEVLSGGWWAVFASPLEFTQQLTLESYS